MAHNDSYKTLESEYTGEFKDRGSKFIAYLFPMSIVETFESRMQELKSEHLKACHHCFAYRFQDTSTFRSSDNGEPSGSAGKPILNQLLSNEIVDVGCIVVRYYGGTNLGVPGLINAYKTATKIAAEAATIVTKYMTTDVQVVFDYAIMGNLMEALKYCKVTIKSTDFGAEPFLTIELNDSEIHDSILSIKAKLLNRSKADVGDTEVEGLKFMMDGEELKKATQ